MWDFERALGLPEPWLRADAPMRKEAEIVRAAVLVRGGGALPPLPAPDRAAEEWAAGRTIPFETTMVEALSLDAHHLVSGPGDQKHPSSLTPRCGDPIALTRREREVIVLLCQRLTDPEIAARLFLGSRTVESHVRNILHKLGATNRRDAAAIAARQGLI